MQFGDFYNFRAKIFLICCLSFILGVALASFLPIKFLHYEMWWFGAAVFFLILALFFWPRRGAIILAFAVFLFSIWRYGLSLPDSAPDKIWFYNGKTVEARGIITNEPDIREASQKLEFTVMAVRGLPLKKISGKILVTADLYPEYEYGDGLEITCELEEPEEFNGFAYDRYLARHDIYSVCYYPKNIISLDLSSGRSSGQVAVGRLYKNIFSFKNFMSGLINRGMSEPEASLARPIIFGGQRGLEQRIRDDFQKAGLTHIMAVSGFNISIIAVIVMAVLLALRINRAQAFYLAAIFLMVYIILVGLPASAMRAGLMGFLVLWALKLGRLNKMTNSLIMTAAVLLLINPRLLRDDAGFQLSFLALAGLVYVYPIFKAIWQKIKWPKLKGLSDAWLITLSAQVFTLPILAYNFNQISLVAPIANLAVLWSLPILTISILGALVLSILWPSLAVLFFTPSLLLTKYILTAVKFFANFKYSHVEIDYLPIAWIILYYLSVIFILIKMRRFTDIIDEHF